jgi:hypothetical protein
MAEWRDLLFVRSVFQLSHYQNQSSLFSLCLCASVVKNFIAFA